MISMEEAHAQLTAPGGPFEIEEVVIRGVPTKTWKNAAKSLRETVERAKAHGDASFIVYEDERTTFEEHFAQRGHVRHPAHRATTACGRATGSPSPCATSPSGRSRSGRAPRAGAIVVPLNAWWTGPELEYGLSRLRREGPRRRRRAAASASPTRFADLGPAS